MREAGAREAIAVAQSAEANVRAELLAERAAKEQLLSELRAEREAELLKKVARLEGQLAESRVAAQPRPAGYAASLDDDAAALRAQISRRKQSERREQSSPRTFTLSTETRAGT